MSDTLTTPSLYGLSSWVIQDPGVSIQRIMEEVQRRRGLRSPFEKLLAKMLEERKPRRQWTSHTVVAVTERVLKGRPFMTTDLLRIAREELGLVRPSAICGLLIAAQLSNKDLDTDFALVFHPPIRVPVNNPSYPQLYAIALNMREGRDMVGAYRFEKKPLRPGAIGLFLKPSSSR